MKGLDSIDIYEGYGGWLKGKIISNVEISEKLNCVYFFFSDGESLRIDSSDKWLVLARSFCSNIKTEPRRDDDLEIKLKSNPGVGSSDLNKENIKTNY